MQRGDVFAHVRPSAVTVSCAGRQWDLHLDSAHEWVGAVGFDLDALRGVVPGAIGDSDVEDMFRLARELPDIDRRWANAARAALGKGSGRDWWWSRNLIKRSLQAWPYINGKLLLSGVRAQATPLPDWLDACYMLLWQNADDKDRVKLDLELSAPPAGVAIRRTKEQTKQMLADFAAD